jgi:hypothetical protein
VRVCTPATWRGVQAHAFLYDAAVPSYDTGPFDIGRQALR